jgi:hypothetical protein
MGNQRAYRALAVADSLVGLTVSDQQLEGNRLVKHMASNPDEVPKKSVIGKLPSPRDPATSKLPKTPFSGTSARH